MLSFWWPVSGRKRIHLPTYFPTIAKLVVVRSNKDPVRKLRNFKYPFYLSFQGRVWNSAVVGSGGSRATRMSRDSVNSCGTNSERSAALDPESINTGQIGSVPPSPSSHPLRHIN